MAEVAWRPRPSPARSFDEGADKIQLLNYVCVFWFRLEEKNGRENVDSVSLEIDIMMILDNITTTNNFFSYTYGKKETTN